MNKEHNSFLKIWSMLKLHWCLSYLPCSVCMSRPISHYCVFITSSWQSLWYFVKLHSPPDNPLFGTVFHPQFVCLFSPLTFMCFYFWNSVVLCSPSCRHLFVSCLDLFRLLVALLGSLVLSQLIFHSLNSTRLLHQIPCINSFSGNIVLVFPALLHCLQMVPSLVVMWEQPLVVQMKCLPDGFHLW